MRKKNFIPVASAFFALMMLILNMQVMANNLYPVKDSIGIKSIGGKKYIVHKISKGESFYSIARLYSVTVKEIEEANPDISDKIIAGKILFIPLKELPESAPVNAKPIVEKTKDTAKKETAVPVKVAAKKDTVIAPANATSAKQQTPIKYKVVGGDNLGIIAGKYHTTIANIKQWNNLKSDRINIDQSLIVGYENSNEPLKTDTTKAKPAAKPPVVKDTLLKKDIAPAKKDTAVIKKPEKSASMSNEYKTFQANNKPMKEVQEKGVAAWIDDEDVNPRKYFALHRTAPIGTIIKVTNPMNNRYVFVKVVGTLPDTGDNANLVIKISKASATKLEVLDAHFQAILDYATNEY
ncbi:MAG: LysM peptidoglycan-binding domain-containing protein [Bacteroidota bacterium]